MWQGLKQAVRSVVCIWWEALDLEETMKMEKTEREFFFFLSGRQIFIPAIFTHYFDLLFLLLVTYWGR